jgi:hypothetical protein
MKVNDEYGNTARLDPNTLDIFWKVLIFVSYIQLRNNILLLVDKCETAQTTVYLSAIH